MIFLNKAKNYFMNGALDLWQRGVSSSSNSVLSGSSSGYFCDRFGVNRGGGLTGTASISRSTDVPSVEQSNFKFTYSSEFQVSGSQSSLSSSQIFEIYQKVEGMVFSPLLGKVINVSFWVKANATGTYSVSVNNYGASRSYVSTFSISQEEVDTWTRKYVSLTLENSGIWNTDNTTGLSVSVVLAAGSAFRALSLDTWYDSAKKSHSSCSNFLSSITNNIKFTGFQLEEGTEPSNFERFGGDILSDKRACLRYYEKSYSAGIYPGDSTSTQVQLVGRCSSSSSLDLMKTNFSVEKRSSPTMKAYSTTGQQDIWKDHNNYSGSLTMVSDTLGFNASFNGTSYTVGSVGLCYGQWTAEIELT